MNNKNIIRTAAIIYSEESSVIKSSTVQRKIIESLFVSNENTELNIDQIVDNLKDSLGMDFDVKEVEAIVNNSKKSNFSIRIDSHTRDCFVKLETKRFNLLKEREGENSIYPHIERFKAFVYKGDLTTDELDKALLRYFYELLNNNIQAFKKIAKSSNQPKNLFLDPSLFNIDERQAINDFLEWNDDTKNKSVFALVSYTIEYAIINNHYESSDVFLRSIKEKIFYLDNNVLYRVIGINGENRQKRMLTFLEKCYQSGQKFKISKYTEQEFIETIKHHIKNLQKVPFKKINYKLFSKYSLNSGLYEYYHKWKSKRTTYGFDLFTTHILSELDNFKKKYSIETVYSIPFDEKDSKNQKVIKEYQAEIATAKGFGNEQSHYFDAVNTFLIEKLRLDNKNTITDTKHFFVSTDQKLRNWDFSRNDYQPIALLPSQWLAILLKYHSRSSNDYASFISFLKLKTNSPIVNEDDLQTILSGISEITEDFEKQETILEKMVELKFEGILNGKQSPEETFQKTIDFVSREYDKELKIAKEDIRTTKLSLENELKNFKTSILKEKKEALSRLSKLKAPIQNRSDKKFKSFKLKLALIVVAYYIGLAVITYKIGWDKMEPITYFLGLLGLFASYLYLTIYGKNFNPVKFFDSKKEEIKESTFKESNFDLVEFENLKTEVSELEAEIKTLHNKQLGVMAGERL